LREITLKILPFQRKVVILHADSVKVKRIPAGQAGTSLSKALLAGGLAGAHLRTPAGQAGISLRKALLVGGLGGRNFKTKK
jgi:hypothetical protein